MRTYPNMNDKYDVQDLKDLNAEDWMIKCLKMNPSYPFWGNYEDYMIKKHGWDAALEFEDIKEGLFKLDEFNECVNFYFEVRRKNIPCEHCEQTGYNPKTKKLHDDWYDISYYKVRKIVCSLGIRSK
mgnify:CR=1 FL=1